MDLDRSKTVIANIELNIEFVFGLNRLLWKRPTSYVLAFDWFINNGIGWG